VVALLVGCDEEKNDPQSEEADTTQSEYSGLPSGASCGMQGNDYCPFIYPTGECQYPLTTTDECCCLVQDYLSCIWQIMDSNDTTACNTSEMGTVFQSTCPGMSTSDSSGAGCSYLYG